MQLDTAMHDIGSDCEDTAHTRHFKIAVDFGTTCSSVAFIELETESDSLPLRISHDDVLLISHFPSAPSEGYYVRQDVPTESWYPCPGSVSHDTMETMLEDSTEHSTPTEDTSESEHSGSEAAMADLKADLALACAQDYLWGYEVQERLSNVGVSNDTGYHMSRFKLMLAECDRTRESREVLDLQIEHLSAQKLIRYDWEIIANYLQCLFSHTRERLIRTHQFNDQCTIEFVLCVPALWTPGACRKMQDAMAAAIKQSKLGTLEDESINNLFIVSEPEAAALCVLKDRRYVSPGDTFILIDAGGGTVDAICYSVERRNPLRLKREEIDPDGILGGSTYLNKKCEQILRKRVKKEDLFDGSPPLDKTIAQAMITFENNIKRHLDIFAGGTRSRALIPMQGLRKNHDKRFSANVVHLSQEEVASIFRDPLDNIAALMLSQLRMANEKGLRVKNVILIGGFAESQSLKTHLEKQLQTFATQHQLSIGLLTPPIPGTAVAQGAIIRALRKEEGPMRFIQSSYGFVQSEPYDEEKPGHVGAETERDKIDGIKYVLETIRWLIVKGELIGPNVGRKIRSSHTFKLTAKKLICREGIYVSDRASQSHYPRAHANNKDAKLEGHVEVDMTFLKTQGLLKPCSPEPGSKIKAKFYRVEFDLVMKVDGRNLKYEAWYPPSKAEEWEENHPGTRQAYGQKSIAAAFLHGTR